MTAGGVGPGAVDVEVADDAHGQAVAGPGQSQVLVQEFADGVGPSRGGGGAEAEVVIFGGGPADAFPVDLGGGGQTDGEAALGAGGQHPFSAQDVDLEGAEGVSEDPRHADHGGEVEDRVDAVEGSRSDMGVSDVAAEEAETGMVQDGSQVLGPSAAEIVEDGHRVALGQEPLDEVGADEASATSDQDMHRPPLLRIDI